MQNSGWPDNRTQAPAGGLGVQGVVTIARPPRLMRSVRPTADGYPNGARG